MDIDRKYIIIALILVIIALVVGIGYALFLHSGVEYQTIQLSNGTTIDAPKSDNCTWTKDKIGVRVYADSIHHVVLTSFNSQEDMTLAGAIAYATVREAMLNGADDVENYNGYQIKENTINGTHIYVVNIVNDTTHDNIFIASENLDILKHMLDSLKFGKPGTATVNATQQSAPTVVDSNNTDDTQFSEDDLRLASEYGYFTGYSDGYDDSANYYDSYSSSDSASSTSYSSGSSSSSDSSYYDYDYDDYDEEDTEGGSEEY